MDFIILAAVSFPFFAILSFGIGFALSSNIEDSGAHWSDGEESNISSVCPICGATCYSSFCSDCGALVAQDGLSYAAM